MEACIDTRNLGEALACCGLAYLASRIDALVETGFTLRDGDAVFACPDEALSALDVDALSVTPDTANEQTSNQLALNWWEAWGMNPGMKLWAGQQTAATVIGSLAKAAKTGSAENWLTHKKVASGRLGVDTLGTWNALSMGWSLNEHSKYQMLCRPYVELLAFIGLQGFPLRGDRHKGFTYHPWRSAPYSIARLAFAGASHHALAAHFVKTTKAGSNTILLAATVTQESS